MDGRVCSRQATFRGVTPEVMGSIIGILRMVRGYGSDIAPWGSHELSTTMTMADKSVSSNTPFWLKDVKAAKGHALAQLGAGLASCETRLAAPGCHGSGHGSKVIVQFEGEQAAVDAVSATGLKSFQPFYRASKSITLTAGIIYARLRTMGSRRSDHSPQS